MHTGGPLELRRIEVLHTYLSAEKLFPEILSQTSQYLLTGMGHMPFVKLVLGLEIGHFCLGLD